MSICHGCVNVHQRIERAQALSMRKVIKCQVRLTPPTSQPATKHPTLRGVGIERQSPIHESRSVVEFPGYAGECVCSHTQRNWIISTQMYCLPGQPHGFGTLLHRLRHPAARLAYHDAIRGHAIGAGKTPVEVDRLTK